MTDFELKIAKVIIDRYDRGRKSFAPKDIDKRYDDIGYINLCDSINETLEFFEKRNYVSLKRHKKNNSIIKALINFDMIEEVAKKYKLTTVVSKMQAAKTVLYEFIGSEFDEVSDFANDILSDIDIGRKPSCASNQSELRDSLLGAEAILAQDSDITLRELSVKVFNDSKRLEKVLPQSLTIIRHSNPVLTDKIILDKHCIVRHDLFVQFKGNAVFSFSNSIENTFTADMGSWQISAAGIEKIISVKTPKILTIENLTSFEKYRVKEDDGLIIFTKGYVENACVDLIRKTNPDCPIFHFGDLDADGFKILHNLQEKCGRTVHSYRMGCEEIDLCMSTGRKMSDHNREQLGKMIESDIYSDAEKLVFKKLLECEKTFEQEALDE